MKPSFWIAFKSLKGQNILLEVESCDVILRLNADVKKFKITEVISKIWYFIEALIRISEDS